MAALTIPDAGLVLNDSPGGAIGHPKSDRKPTQMMGLELPNGILDDILKALQNGAGNSKGVQLALGRTSTLHYGNQSREIASGPETVRHEVYRRSAKGQDMSLAGVVSHRLELRKPEEVTAGADAAMLALQNSMAAIDKEKKSNQTLFVADNSKLPPATSKRAAAKAKTSAGLFKPHRSQLFDHTTTRSLPTSPSQGAARSPSMAASSQPPTSAPSDPSQNGSIAQALRTPLIHLLAMRPTSERTLARTTRCPRDIMRPVLDKVGKPAANDGEWRLNDRVYKELDVWDFGYPTQEDRQAAIDCAVSAFDRQRLSRSDPLWQRLLAKDERGKGKVLSKLHHLHQGPMLLNNNAPAIKVSSTEDGPEATSDTGPEHAGDLSDTGDSHLISTASTAQAQDMKRSTSQPLAKQNKKVSEREAMSKRLLSNSKNPKKPSKKTAKPRETKASEKESSKIKSAEFVHDSDEEDDEMEDWIEGVSPTKPSHPSVDGGTDERREKTKMPEADRSQIHRTSHKSTSSQETLSSPPSSTSSSKKSSRPAPPTKDSAPRRKTSTSPQKPSPLGSSPPANASDSERFYRASSSSSTQSVTQDIKGGGTPSPMPQPPKPSMTSPSAPKRKAAEDDTPRTSTAKRHQANHNHTPSSQRPLPPPPPPTAPSATTATFADDFNSSSGGSSSASPPPPTLIFSQTLSTARKFKDFHAKYVRLHAELSKTANPSVERVGVLLKMRSRLEGMKTGIFRAVGGGGGGGA